jgi:putative transposase
MLIRRGFTRRLLAAGLLDPVASGQRGATERALWQPRCWAHPIRDETDFSRHVDYIHFNPVQHGLVERAADWPYSSFHRFVRQGLLEPDWRLASPAGEGWFGE